MDFHIIGICIDSVEIWFGIVHGQFLSILIEFYNNDMSIFSFPMIT